MPLDEAAKQAILMNDVHENLNIQFYALPDGEVFESLWEKGLFSAINEQLGTMIDDYEEEVITPAQLHLLKETTTSFLAATVFEQPEKQVIEELLALCHLAIRNTQPIFIIF